MANTVQHRRGSTSSINSHLGAPGEFVYNTTTKRIHAMDGSTLGGAPHALLSDLDSKAERSTTISAGTGLTGGGSLAANRTIALNSTSIASLAKADSSVQTVNGNPPDGSGNVIVDAEFLQEQNSVTTAMAESFASTVEWVRTAGYAASGDGGGALYKRALSEPSHAGKFQSADGAWWELCSEPTAYTFGAIGDGISNDRVALSALAEYCAIKSKEMRLGAGVFFCGNAGIVCTGVGKVSGEGRQNTKISFSSSFSGDGLFFSVGIDEEYSQQVEICGLTIETLSPAVGAAITIVGDPSINTDRTTNRLTIRDVFVTGKENAFQDGFDIGINLVNITNALVDGYSFRGKVSSGGEAAGYDSDYAISYDGNGESPHQVGLTVSNCFIAYAKYGLRAYDFEGLLVQSCQIIGVDKGVLMESFVDHPHASLVNSHINAASICVEIINVKQNIIMGNALYNQIGNFSGEHIDIVGLSTSNIICNNVFENLKPTFHSNSVVLRGTVSHSMISGNVWHRTDSADGSDTGGVCVWFQSGTSWNKAPAAMNIYNASGNYGLDQGVNNLI